VTGLLPDELADARRFVERYGPKASTVIPMWAGDRVIGAASFGKFRSSRKWPPDLLDHLALAVRLFGSAIERKQRGTDDAWVDGFIGEMCPAMTLLCKNMRVALRSSRYTSALRVAACLSIVTLTACDPIITIAGANFPSWLFCMIVGAILAAIVRPILVLARLEPYLGPLPIFYPSLIAMFAMIVWVIFFNRV
jgi:hypothetical protein